MSNKLPTAKEIMYSEMDMSPMQKATFTLYEPYLATMEKYKDLHCETLKKENEILRQGLNSILNVSHAKGKEGCTYGDSPYDSLSAAYGYNEALDEVKMIANDVLEQNKQLLRKEE